MTSASEHSEGIGTRMRAARRRRGWSREALAFHARLSWSAIAQIESGRRNNVRPGTLSALASALGVTIDYLVSGGQDQPPMLDHRALLYESDAAFAAATVPMLSEAVEYSEAAMAVTTAANIELLKRELGERSGQVEFVENSTWYADPESALGRYVAFADAQLEAGSPWVWIVGEPVWLGRSESETLLRARSESLINIIFGSRPVTILCPYDVRVLDERVLALAGETHPWMVRFDVSAASSDFIDPNDYLLRP
ncbi:MAG: MEDS domain-containing protein [Solirubrobacteraceae bacterium]